MIEVPVERIVERIVEIPIERTVEHRVEVPVERIVEKFVEVPPRPPLPPFIPGVDQGGGPRLQAEGPPSLFPKEAEAGSSPAALSPNSYLLNGEGGGILLEGYSFPVSFGTSIQIVGEGIYPKKRLPQEVLPPPATKLIPPPLWIQVPQKRKQTTPLIKISDFRTRGGPSFGRGVTWDPLRTSFSHQSPFVGSVQVSRPTPRILREPKNTLEGGGEWGRGDSRPPPSPTQGGGASPLS